MDKVKPWAANLFFGIAGNALWTWLTGGFLTAGATTVFCWLRASNPLWLDRGITSLTVLAIVTGGSAIQTLILRKRRRTETAGEVASAGTPEVTSVSA
jgi:hypothetical protein